MSRFAGTVQDLTVVWSLFWAQLPVFDWSNSLSFARPVGSAWSRKGKHLEIQFTFGGVRPGPACRSSPGPIRDHERFHEIKLEIKKHLEKERVNNEPADEMYSIFLHQKNAELIYNIGFLSDQRIKLFMGESGQVV